MIPLLPPDMDEKKLNEFLGMYKVLRDKQRRARARKVKFMLLVVMLAWFVFLAVQVFMASNVPLWVALLILGFLGFFVVFFFSKAH